MELQDNQAGVPGGKPGQMNPGDPGYEVPKHFWQHSEALPALYQ